MKRINPQEVLYILIAQDRVRVEVRTRGEAAWSVRVWNRLDETIEMPAIGISLPIAEIYDRLDLPTGLQPVYSGSG